MVEVAQNQGKHACYVNTNRLKIHYIDILLHDISNGALKFIMDSTNILKIM